MTFSEIEKILEFALPNSAYKYNAWWANDITHSHSASWMNNGFRVDKVDLVSKTIKFTSNKTQESSKEKLNHLQPTSVNDLIRKKIDKIELNDYIFYETPYVIIKSDIEDVAIGYKNRLVKDVLAKKQYNSIKADVYSNYSEFLNQDISIFMKFLKGNDELLYFKFLNKNGDDLFCQFKLSDKAIYNSKGLYLYCLDGDLKYIGRCLDNFHKRFNVNYGKIQPINCFKEGQSTNTHINSLVNQYKERISIYICPLINESEIKKIEKDLIRIFSPEWNKRM